MKIKAVCEATGLTDRAVRYYIEEGLLAPAFTENYLGRKSFDFSEEDVAALERIAKLRMYDFSVAEIGGMIRSPETIGAVCGDLIARKREKLKEDARILKALEKVPGSHPASVNELVDALEKPAGSVPMDQSPKLLSRIGNGVLTALIAAPVALALLTAALSFIGRRQPRVNTTCAIVMLVSLLPALLAVFVPKRIKAPKRRVAAKIVLGCLCAVSILSIFSGGLFLVYGNGTDRVKDYLKSNAVNWPRGDAMFDELFPAREQFLGEDSEDRLYYCAAFYEVFDDAIEITAQRRLSVDGFALELSRVKTAFDSYYSEQTHYQELYGRANKYGSDTALKMAEIRRGGYNCLALYTDEEPFGRPEIDRGYYYIFAYNSQTRTVRYFYYNGTYAYEPVFFYGMDWE